MLKFLREALAKLQERRAGLTTAMEAVLAAPTTENRALTDAETTTFDETRAAILKLDVEISAQEERIRDAEAIEARSRLAAQAAGQTGQLGDQTRSPGDGVITSEPMAYGEGSGHSYFLDLTRAQLGMGDGDGGVEAARDRLKRHEAELRVELPAREARREQRAQRELRGIDNLPADRHGSVFEKRVNPNRTDGQGGNFVPPLWLIDEYIDLPRFGRTTANLVQNLTLPSGTDSINLPKVATGTAVAMQTADAAAVQSTDLTDTFVNAPVRTLAGQQDVAMQLLDQSPVSFDQIVFADLIGDYNAKLDVQVINGSGSAGQVSGILGTSGINAVTYTDASPTLPELWVPLLQSASKVATQRKLPATAVVLTPSMWYWALSQLDTTNRPLMIPAPMSFNPMGNPNQLDADGIAGQFTYGLPAFLDGNVPSNLGGGTNETRIITARWSDLYLWEGQMRTRVLTEILSGTLQVRLQIYAYIAFMPNRRPESISVISGTGVIPTAGF